MTTKRDLLNDKIQEAIKELYPNLSEDKTVQWFVDDLLDIAEEKDLLIKTKENVKN